MKAVFAKLFVALFMLSTFSTFAVSTQAATPTALESANTTTANAGLFGTYRVRGNSTNSHRVFLDQGRYCVAISGDGDTDLDLYIYDSYNNLISRSASYSDDEVTCINVYRASYFYIRVVNRGRVYNDYAFGVE